MIIAGERSGVGKTTLTLALLAFLVRQGYRVQAFKVGPDYIDPMFHTAITGIPSRNLDPILTSPEYVKSCFTRHSQTVDFAVVEGVMGLFDGVNLTSSPANYASTAHIAKILQIPIVLVIDCSSLSGSVAAIAHGYASLDSQVKIAGVILNKVGSDRHKQLLTSALAAIQMPILGIFRRNKEITIPDRHLGLVPTEELPQMPSIREKLADLAASGFNWDLLLPLLKKVMINRKQENTNPYSLIPTSYNPIKIAVARDRAFNFYYQDNFDILEELGAKLVFWSPLEAQELPKDISGMYFGGGFPEVFAETLSNNASIRKQIYQAFLAKMPIYAECGGLMYLCDRIIDFNGKSWSMVGAIPTTARMSQKLTLGYRQVTNSSHYTDSEFGDRTWGHEFHRSQLDDAPEHPLWYLTDLYGKTYPEGWQQNQLHASYLHIHWGKYKNFLQKWLKYCRNYKNWL